MFAQELQPGQAFLLIRPQLQAESGRRWHVADALGGKQAFGQGHDVALATELPATEVAAQGFQARGIETRQAQGVAAGKAVKKVDQRRRQRLQSSGRRAQAATGRGEKFDTLIVRNVGQRQRVEPARIALEQGRQ